MNSVFDGISFRPDNYGLEVERTFRKTVFCQETKFEGPNAFRYDPAELVSTNVHNNPPVLSRL